MSFSSVPMLSLSGRGHFTVRPPRRAWGVTEVLNCHGQLPAAGEKEGQDYRGLFALWGPVQPSTCPLSWPRSKPTHCPRLLTEHNSTMTNPFLLSLLRLSWSFSAITGRFIHWIHCWTALFGQMQPHLLHGFTTCIFVLNRCRLHDLDAEPNRKQQSLSPTFASYQTVYASFNKHIIVSFIFLVSLFMNGCYFICTYGHSHPSIAVL